MRVTLRDIAQRANVSPSTVSRVLNNYPFVDDVTRTAVMDAARELKYPVDEQRRALAVNRVALLLTRSPVDNCADGAIIGGELERLLAAGSQPVLAEHGLTLRLQHTCMSPDQALLYAHEPGVAGLLISGGVVNRDFIRGLQAAGVPFVVAAAPVYPFAINCATFEYARGADSAVRHLAKTGRRRIGLVNGATITSTSEEKFRGYRYALAMQDLPFEQGQVVNTPDFDPEDGYVGTQRLLAQSADLDAILYAADHMALGGLRAIKESGRRVPDDLAVIGFMDYEIARFTDPPLTTVRTDMQKIGAVAARRLVMLIGKPDGEAWCISLPTQLIVRESA
jgi:DNA-binding LacI/PurR family transcriptional regulator